MNTNNENTSEVRPPPEPPAFGNDTSQKRFKLLSCEIIFREACQLAARSEHIIDVEFLRKGLHDAGQEKMSQAIQDAIDAVDKDQYDAILLGYGLCNNGIIGLRAEKIPLVIPRAHDCITFFFGSREKYEKYFSQNPGTYYRTTGWTERDNPDSDSVMHQLGLDRTYDEYVATYGRENAEYIMESLGNWHNNYKYLVYIDMQMPMDEKYALRAQKEAREKSLEFIRMTGDWSLLEDLISGNWREDDFLVVLPDQEVASEDNNKIIKAVTTSEKKT